MLSISTPVGEDRGENSRKEAGRPMPNHGDSREARPPRSRAAAVGPWEAALGLFSEPCLPGQKRQGPTAAEGSLENNLKTVLLWAVASAGEDRLRVFGNVSGLSPTGLRGHTDSQGYGSTAPRLS